MRSDNKIFFFSIDVQAHPALAQDDHIAKLVYGIFGAQKPAGLSRLLDIAERFDCRVTCFLDFCEYDIYGNQWLDVARYICARGHSLQLHAHPEYISRETWQRLGLKSPPRDLSAFTYDQATVLFDYLLDLRARVTEMPAVAFRGGFYRLNDAVMDCLKARGISVFSGNPAREACDSSLQKFFYYPNGGLGVPLTTTMPGFTPVSLREVDKILDKVPDNTAFLLNPVISSTSLLDVDEESGMAVYGEGQNKISGILERARDLGFQFAKVEELAFCARYHGDPFRDCISHADGDRPVETLSLSEQLRETAISAFWQANFARAVEQGSYRIFILSGTGNLAKCLCPEKPELVSTLISNKESNLARSLEKFSKGHEARFDICIFDALGFNEECELEIHNLIKMLNSHGLLLIFGEHSSCMDASDALQAFLYDTPFLAEKKLPQDFVSRTHFFSSADKNYFCIIAGKARKSKNIIPQTINLPALMDKNRHALNIIN